MRVTRPSEAPSITCETTLTSISNATILEPAQAEEALRFAHNRPIEWAAFAAVRACVTDPSDRTLSMFQVAGFIKDFDGRGMGSIRATIIEVLNDGRLLGAALSAAARHGVSNAGRYERPQGHCRGAKAKQGDGPFREHNHRKRGCTGGANAPTLTS